MEFSRLGQRRWCRNPQLCPPQIRTLHALLHTSPYAAHLGARRSAAGVDSPPPCRSAYVSHLSVTQVLDGMRHAIGMESHTSWYGLLAHLTEVAPHLRLKKPVEAPGSQQKPPTLTRQAARGRLLLDYLIERTNRTTTRLFDVRPWEIDGDLAGALGYVHPRLLGEPHETTPPQAWLSGGSSTLLRAPTALQQLPVSSVPTCACRCPSCLRRAGEAARQSPRTQATLARSLHR